MRTTPTTSVNHDINNHDPLISHATTNDSAKLSDTVRVLEKDTDTNLFSNS
jgi:hypothetical protein